MPKYKKVKCGKVEYLIDLEEVIGSGAYGKAYFYNSKDQHLLGLQSLLYFSICKYHQF